MFLNCLLRISNCKVIGLNSVHTFFKVQLERSSILHNKLLCFVMFAVLSPRMYHVHTMILHWLEETYFSQVTAPFSTTFSFKQWLSQSKRGAYFRSNVARFQWRAFPVYYGVAPGSCSLYGPLVSSASCPPTSTTLGCSSRPIWNVAPSRRYRNEHCNFHPAIWLLWNYRIWLSAI